MKKIIAIDVNATFKGKHEQYDGVAITLDDNTQFKFGISDSSQCCENWGYLHAVDDVNDFIGASYLGWEERDTWPEGADKVEMYDTAGFQAIDVKTDRGVMQFVVYNDHNGYYSHSTIVKLGDAVLEASSV